MQREVRMAPEWMEKKATELLSDKEYVESHLVYNLVNKRNVRPTEIFDPVFGGNIGMVYRIILREDAGAVITKDTVDSMFNGNLNKVRELARRNTPKLRPPMIMGLNEMTFNLMKEAGMKDVEMPEEEVTYVLTNEGKMNGAATILYPEIFELIKTKFNGPFYIIPSSIHEVILYPIANGADPAELKAMIMGVNADVVDPFDYLGDAPILSTEIMKAQGKMLDKTIQKNEELIDFQERIVSELMDTFFSEV